MAQRLLQQDQSSSTSSHPSSAELLKLALRTLEQQSKYSDMLELVQKLPIDDDDHHHDDYDDDNRQHNNNHHDNDVDVDNDNKIHKNNDGSTSDASHRKPPTTSDFGIALTPNEIQTEKARILIALERYDDASNIYESLIQKAPDDWSCWMGHLKCTEKMNEEKEGLSRTWNLVNVIISQSEGQSSKYPLRGPHLMKVELMAHPLRSMTAEVVSDDAMKTLSKAIQTYANLFAHRASCTYSDIEPYIELMVSCSFTSNDTIQDLLTWATSLLESNESFRIKEGNGISNKERQSRLRTYIFAMRVLHKVLSKRIDLQSQFLPNVSNMIQEWKASLSLLSSNEGEEVSKTILLFK